VHGSKPTEYCWVQTPILCLNNVNLNCLVIHVEVVREPVYGVMSLMSYSVVS
jgi:hypothetical protein